MVVRGHPCRYSGTKSCRIGKRWIVCSFETGTSDSFQGEKLQLGLL